MDSLDIGLELSDDSNSDNEIDELIIHQENIIIPERMINNFLYPSYSNIIIRFNNDISSKILYENFGLPYIICLDDSKYFHEYFYNNVITSDQLDVFKDSIRVIKASYKVNLGSMTKYMTAISSDLFNSLNAYDNNGNVMRSDKEVLIYNLSRFRYNNVINYLKQYDGISNIRDLYNLVLMNGFLGQPTILSETKHNICEMIKSMREFNYYTLYRNCCVNITNKFMNRTLNLSYINQTENNDININKVLQILNNNDREGGGDYLNGLPKFNNFVDISESNNTDGNHKYKITNNKIINHISKYNIVQLFDCLSYNAQAYLVLNGMASKELCHLIVNNKDMLTRIMSDDSVFMSKYAQVIRYTLGYAWLTFYMEESIKRSFITKNDRFIFDIDTASLLPFFPHATTNLYVCPYISLTVDIKVVNAYNNILGVRQYYCNNVNPEQKKILRYGVCTKETFIKRINIFISGLVNENILENIKWDNLAISGSIMACCVPNFNPLMFNFMNNINNNINIDFVKFIEEYYKDADIDIMCNITNIYEYVDRIYEFKKQLDVNIDKIYKLNIINTVDVSQLFSNKSMSIMINKNFIKANIMDKIDMSYDNILINLNNPSIKTIIYNHYIKSFQDQIKQNINENYEQFINPKYHELFIPVSYENVNVVFVTNKYESKDENDDPDIIIFSPKVNYKFRIRSSYLPHNIEFFQIKYPEFFSTVSKFHLPIVRSYYDGDNVYLCPSCISACMTFLNIDYKYFAGSKDPLEIVNKYRMRGFGTILNEQERTKLYKYSSLVSKWKQLYNISTSNAPVKMNGHLANDINFFRPSTVLDNKQAFKPNLGQIDIYAFSNDDSEIPKYIKKLYTTQDMPINNTINLNSLTTINSNGTINPLKKWIFDAIIESKFF